MVVDVVVRSRAIGQLEVAEDGLRKAEREEDPNMRLWYLMTAFGAATAAVTTLDPDGELERAGGGTDADKAIVSHAAKLSADAFRKTWSMYSQSGSSRSRKNPQKRRANLRVMTKLLRGT